MPTVAEKWEAMQEARYQAGFESAEDFDEEVGELTGRYAVEIENRLSGGNLSWNARKTDNDACAVSRALVEDCYPDMLAEAAILAMRNDAAGLLKVMKNLFNEAIEMAAEARAIEKLERMAARPWDCDYDGDD